MTETTCQLINRLETAQEGDGAHPVLLANRALAISYLVRADQNPTAPKNAQVIAGMRLLLRLP